MMLATMICWALVAPVALLMAHGVVLGQPSFGLAVLATLSGLGLSVLYVLLAGPAGLAWAEMGCAVLAFLAASVGANGLVSSSARPATVRAQHRTESAALWAGLLLPLLLAVGLMSIYTALHGVTAY